MNIQQQIEKRFKNKYNYPFFIRSNQNTFEINVFNVPYGKIDEIEKFILNLDWLFRFDCAIIPFIFDEETTKRYYPEYKNMINNPKEMVYIGPGQKAEDELQIDLNYGMRGTAIPTDNGIDFRPEGLNVTHYVNPKYLALRDEQRQRVNKYL